MQRTLSKSQDLLHNVKKVLLAGWRKEVEKSVTLKYIFNTDVITDAFCTLKRSYLNGMLVWRNIKLSIINSFLLNLNF